jgi:hypothetical protein
MTAPTRAAIACVLLMGAHTALGQPTITWYTIDGGGGWAYGDVFSMAGTIGQADAGYMSDGGSLELFGGFWYGGFGTLCPADFDQDGFLTGTDYDLFVQAFEAGDPASDFDDDNFITGVDFDLFVQAFEAGC